MNKGEPKSVCGAVRVRWHERAREHVVGREKEKRDGKPEWRT